MITKARASITLSGNAPPVLWTDYFGMKPDIYVVKGELFRTPSGRMSRSPGRVNVWGCRSESAVASDMLDPHIDYLLTLLGLPRLDLPDLMVKRETTMRVFCYWYSEENEVPIIDSRIQEIIVNSGGTIEIDHYPKPDTDFEPDRP